MIKIRNAEILDILPHTFKTNEYRALSAAIARLTADLYDVLSAILFRSDIKHADSVVLDALAAEVAAPFYLRDMSAEKKREILLAADSYNSRIGTVSAVEELLIAAFGGGKIEEWFEYGGEPFYFRLNLDGVELEPIDKLIIENFYKSLERVKNKRSKLEALRVISSYENRLFISGAATVSRREYTVPSEKAPGKVKYDTKKIYISGSVGVRKRINVIHSEKAPEKGRYSTEKIYMCGNAGVRRVLNKIPAEKADKTAAYVGDQKVIMKLVSRRICSIIYSE